MCGPWVSDRAVSGLWSSTWIGGLGWRRCRRPPLGLRWPTVAVEEAVVDVSVVQMQLAMVV